MLTLKKLQNLYAMDDSKEPLRVVFKSEETPLNASVDGRNLIDSYKGKSIEEIKNNLTANKTPFEVAIENFQHDFNIGTVVRNANAFNARAVHIIGKKHWNRRGAMKTEVYLDVYHHKDVANFIAWSKANSKHLIAIDNQEGSILLNNAEMPKDSILIFGNENDGLSKEMIENCDKMVAIEQFGSTRSVNVGVASGIIMYEFARRYRL